MSFLIAAPEFMADAALNLANIGSAIGSANLAAAAATSGVLPAAADEVSATIATLFSQHAVGYQQLSAQAEAFHQLFVESLTAGAGTYAAAEVNVVQTLASAVPALGVDLSGGLGGIAAGLNAEISQLGASLNLALSGSFGGSLSGLAPLGAALAADLNGGLTMLAQTGGALATNIGANLSGLSGLSGSLAAGLPGLQASLSGGLSGLSAQLNAALSGGLSGGLNGALPGLGAGLSALLQTGQSLAGSLGAGLPALTGGLGAALSGALGAGLTGSLSGGLAGLANILGFGPGLGASLGLALSGLGAQLSTALSGALTLGLSGLPTALLNLTAPFQLLLSAPSPAALLAQLQAMELNFNAALLNAELGFNGALVAQEQGIELALFGNLGNLGLNSFYNFWNMVLDTGEATVNSLIGVQFPAALLATSLTVGTSPTIGGGLFGGLLAAVPTKFLWDLGVVEAVAGAFLGGGSLQAALGAAIGGLGLQASLGATLGGSLFAGLPTGASLVAAPIAGLQGIGTTGATLLTDLAGSEAAFNTNLLANELGLETSLFGSNVALNGAVNRFLNAGNLALLTGEQTINSFLGGGTLNPALTVGGFLAGSGSGVFNGGNIGGIEGVLDQILAGGADLAGLL